MRTLNIYVRLEYREEESLCKHAFVEQSKHSWHFIEDI